MYPHMTLFVWVHKIILTGKALSVWVHVPTDDILFVWVHVLTDDISFAWVHVLTDDVLSV